MLSSVFLSKESNSTKKQAQIRFGKPLVKPWFVPIWGLGCLEIVLCCMTCVFVGAPSCRGFTLARI